MGIFKFIKDKGQELKKFNENQKEAITDHLKELGIAADGLEIKVENDEVTVAGELATQEAKEKVLLAIGNTRGVAQISDNLVVNESAAESVLYTVKSGDTLSKIAKEHYGDAMKYPVIFDANKPMLKDPDRIYPGQVLRIPSL